MGLNWEKKSHSSQSMIGKFRMRSILLFSTGREVSKKMINIMRADPKAIYLNRPKEKTRKKMKIALFWDI